MCQSVSFQELRICQTAAPPSDLIQDSVCQGDKVQELPLGRRLQHEQCIQDRARGEASRRVRQVDMIREDGTSGRSSMREEMQEMRFGKGSKQAICGAVRKPNYGSWRAKFGARDGIVAMLNDLLFIFTSSHNRGENPAVAQFNVKYYLAYPKLSRPSV